MDAQLVFTNGVIYTMDEMKQVTQIAVTNGKISAVGDAVKNEMGSHTKVIDLKGKTMIPGIIESHAHPMMFATNRLGVNLKPAVVHSVEEIVAAVRERAKVVPKGEWITGTGWDDVFLAEQRPPTIDELSAAAPDHPVFLKRTCGHNAVANRMAFEKSGLSMRPTDPAGGHFVIDPVTNEVSGLIQENAQKEFAIPPFTEEQQAQAMIDAQQQFFEWGITTVHDMAVTPQMTRVYQKLRTDDSFKMKVRMWLWAIDALGWEGMEASMVQLGFASGFGDDYLNVQGMKYMLDGSVGGRTAAVSESYEGEDANHGILYLSQETLNTHVKQAVESNLRVSIHAIGEFALDQAIEAITQAAPVEKNAQMRNRIEHVTLPTHEHLKQMQAYKIVAASSVGFIYSIGDSYIQNLGAERVERVFPHKTFKEYGLVAPGNSDLPVCDGNPMYGVYSAVTRKTIKGQQMGTKECISVEDALKSYTLDAAYSGFDEAILGSITVGKYADLVVLEQNPFEIAVDALKDVRVVQTYVDGELVYER